MLGVSFCGWRRSRWAALEATVPRGNNVDHLLPELTPSQLDAGEGLSGAHWATDIDVTGGVGLATGNAGCAASWRRDRCTSSKRRQTRSI